MFNLNVEMKFSRVRNVKPVNRANAKDAGMDFYIPEFSEEFIKDLENKNPKQVWDYTNSELMIEPGGSLLIPSGIKVRLPENFMLTAFNKSGIASKKSLLVGACVVDEPYMGEVHIDLHNVSSYTQSIEYGQKIIQLILIPVSYAVPQEVAMDDLYTNFQSTRGEGGFGSSGVK
jgi:dUTP pyrophosphatase